MSKKILVLLLTVLVGGLFAASKKSGQVLRVHYQDGTYKDYPVARVNKVDFIADADDPTEPDPKNESDDPINKVSSSGMANVSSSSAKSQEKSSSSKGKTLVQTQMNFGSVARWNAGSKTLILESRENTKAEVSIFGPQGNSLATKNVLLIPGYNSVYFNEVELARSVYIVRVKTASKEAILKIQEMK